MAKTTQKPGTVRVKALHAVNIKGVGLKKVGEEFDCPQEVYRTMRSRFRTIESVATTEDGPAQEG